MQNAGLLEKLSTILNTIELCSPQQKKLFEQFIDRQLELSQVFISKQLDYGPDNIAKFGEIGTIIRMNDKFERLLNLVFANKEAKNEAIEDTYDDISVYAIIARLCRTNNWPGVRRFALSKVE